MAQGNYYIIETFIFNRFFIETFKQKTFASLALHVFSCD